MRQSRTDNTIDPAVRIFHWLLVICLTACYITAQLDIEWLYWHIHFGCIILSLMVFRVIRGLSGPPRSQLLSYIPTIATMKEYYFSSHTEYKQSPHGAAAALILLILIMSQSTSGLFSIDDDIDIAGPLYQNVSTTFSEQMTITHLWLAEVIPWAVGMHISALVYYQFARKKNLFTSMTITTEDIYTSDCQHPVNLLIAAILALSVYIAIKSGLASKAITWLFQ